MGPLIAIIGHLIGDIVRYFVLYGIFLIPYVICFWLMFGGDRAEGEPENSDLTKVYRMTIMVFRLSHLDEYPYAVSVFFINIMLHLFGIKQLIFNCSLLNNLQTLRNIDELMAVILVVSFSLIAAIIGLNLFIALLSDTFQRVYDNAQANALLQQVRNISLKPSLTITNHFISVLNRLSKAQLILSYEEKVCPCIYERYLRHIQTNCNPSSLYYDDDDQQKEQPPELQKITHQIHVDS